MNADKRILVSWHTEPSYIPPFRLSQRQVTAGPNTGAPGLERYFDLLTPKGAYDLHALLRRSRIEPRFDLVVVSADASLTNQPLNLSAFDCPKLLCVGDTHHMNRPLQSMLTYARRAGFDYIVSSYNRHHLHWFAETGFARVAWIPALKVQHLPRPLNLERAERLVFIGSTGPMHLRRRHLLEAVHRQGLPLISRSDQRPAAADLYATSLLSFNASLNGDLNLRVFEILSAGGCLVTDRLAPESGLSLLIEEGRHLLCYGSLEELLEIVRRGFAEPASLHEIARAGHEAFVERLLPKHQAGALLRWVFQNELDPLHSLDWDPRPGLNKALPAPLGHRVQTYERLLDQQIKQERLSVLVAAEVPPVYVADLMDLPRVDAALLEPSASLRDALATVFADRVLQTIDLETARQRPWDFVIAPETDWVRRNGLKCRQVLAAPPAPAR